MISGEKVQIDVKEVPHCCLRGAAKRDEKHSYQWTAIDECTRIRFVYGFEKHTLENSVKFLNILHKAFISLFRPCRQTMARSLLLYFKRNAPYRCINPDPGGAWPLSEKSQEFIVHLKSNER